MPKLIPGVTRSAVSTRVLSTSVIIPTKDRPAALRDTLATLLCQTVLPAEIIIIDQSRNSETRDVVTRANEDRKESSSVWPRFIYHCDPGINGAAAARNVGIELSSCSILLFLDDDVLLENSFHHEILEVYRQQPDIGMVSGIISNYQKPSFCEGLFERFFCVGPFRDERLRICWSAESLRHSSPIPVRKMTGAVMSVSRSALGCERFNHTERGRCEDIDLSWRVSEHFRSVLTPRARLAHVRTNENNARGYWVTSAAIDYYYLYYRYWKSGVTNWLAFSWLNCGLIVISTVSSLHHCSLKPLRALVDGLKVARTFRVA